VGLGLDVTDPQSVARAAADVADRLGPVDVLVNNAGWDELRPFLETDEAFWDHVIEVNYKGCMRMTHAVLPGMLERGWGRIVNIGSDAGRVGSSLESVYSGAKGAVIAFTKTIARESARSGVTANTVCPGPTRTPMLEGMATAGGGRLVEALEKAVPMRRLGEPEDVADAVAVIFVTVVEALPASGPSAAGRSAGCTASRPTSSPSSAAPAPGRPGPCTGCGAAR
jgi:2-hydroxycyclohexanecarboxyl-CoA dehydrogenase